MKRLARLSLRVRLTLLFAVLTAAAWGVWLLFVALAVYMVKKSSGKPRPKRV